MKPITYLCFTLLSILIQFCLMDFINERIQTDNTFIDNKRTVARNLSYVLKNIKEKPHAIYYRNEPLGLERNTNVTTKTYRNTSLPMSTFTTTTEYTSTLFDLFYDENVSMTDGISTTEIYDTDSEYGNVTEITFFDKKSTTKPTETPKKGVSKNNCECDLLFNKCDINCCCDSECSKEEYKLFHCKGGNKDKCFNYNRNLQFYCLFQDSCSKDFDTNIFNNIFCIERVNLPDKNVQLINKPKNIEINRYFKWHTRPDDRLLYKFTKNIYEYGQPVWLLRNESLSTISLPITVTNGYCDGKRPIKFLTNEHIKCYVKIKELHFLYASEVSTVYSNIVSPTEMTRNSTTVNCSTVHCINWTVLVCNDYNCIEYNKSLHEPSCSEIICDNVGIKVEYIFYCNESNITKAIIKIHTTQVSTYITYFSQEVIVKFYMGNNYIENIVTHSGNPGYIEKLPVIASFFKSNHTKHFYNRTNEKSNYLVIPYNQNGKCVVTNMTHNVVKIGVNTRLKCRLTIDKSNVIHNITDECLKIQMELIKLLRLNDDIFISPFGNPYDTLDRDWIRLQGLNKSNIYGEYLLNKSRMQCYNLITRFHFIFTYTTMIGVKRETKILSATVAGTARNVTFAGRGAWAVLTVDASFARVRAAGAAPARRGFQNVFFPFRNGSYECKHRNIILFVCTILFLSK